MRSKIYNLEGSLSSISIITSLTLIYKPKSFVHCNFFSFLHIIYSY